MMKWLEFTTRCALLPVMAIVSVLVNSDPNYCNDWLPKAFMNLKIIIMVVFMKKLNGTGGGVRPTTIYFVIF